MQIPSPAPYWPVAQRLEHRAHIKPERCTWVRIPAGQHCREKPGISNRREVMPHSVGANPITGAKYAEASHGGAVVPRIPGSTEKGINSVRAGSIPAFGSPHRVHGCPSGSRGRPAKSLFASSNLVPCSNL